MSSRPMEEDKKKSQFAEQGHPIKYGANCIEGCKERRRGVQYRTTFLMRSVKNHTQLLINCRNNRKLFGTVRAFDRHCNMVLENVKEMWTEVPRTRKGKKKAQAVNKDRFISKMFIRGNSVIIVLRNPK